MKKKLWKIPLPIAIVLGILLVTGIGFALNGYFGGGGKIPEDTFTRGLVGYWSMDESTGPLVFDGSGQGNDGMINDGGQGNPVSYWTFDEGEGSTAYDWIGSNHGTLKNNPTWTSSGRIGGALEFDGVDDYVQMPLVTSVTTNVTLSVWVYLSSNSLKGTFIHNGSGTTNGDGYSLGVGSTDSDNNGNNLIGLLDSVAWMNFNVPIGTGWHFVVMTRDTSTWRGYVDGVVSTTTYTNSPITPTSGTYIARDCDNSPRFFNGLIAEVRIYNRALTLQEILDHYIIGKEMFG